MARPRAWLLNFDAGDELGAGPGYTPSSSVLQRFQVLTEQVLGLLAPGDVLLGAGAEPLPAGVFLGQAWCPTPRALKALGAAGATLPEAPPVEVLKRVNHRRFCAELGQTLPGACFAESLDEVARVLALPSPSGPWLLKRAFGYAGRGKRRIAPGSLGGPDRAWVLASLHRGAGLQIEPLVERTLDVGVHGFVSARAELWLGAPTVQVVDAAGVWRASARAEEGALAEAELGALREAVEESAAALRSAGYFGPFGMDAFRWRDAESKLRFNARCEINARYSMGWAIGMGDVRPDLA